MRAILAHLACKNKQERGICDMVPQKDANRQVQLVLLSKAFLFHRKDDGFPSFDWHVKTTTRSAIRNAVPHAHLHGDVPTCPGVVLHRRPLVESRGDGVIIGRTSAVLARRPCGEQCHVRARIGVDARVVSDARVHRSTTTSQGPFVDRRDRRSFPGPQGCVPRPRELEVTFLRPRLARGVWGRSTSLNFGLTPRGTGRIPRRCTRIADAHLRSLCFFVRHLHRCTCHSCVDEAMASVMQKIRDIEDEMARTQKNKATAGHLGLLKAKLAKLRRDLLEPEKASEGWRRRRCDVDSRSADC